MQTALPDTQSTSAGLVPPSGCLKNTDVKAEHSQPSNRFVDQATRRAAGAIAVGRAGSIAIASSANRQAPSTSAICSSVLQSASSSRGACTSTARH